LFRGLLANWQAELQSLLFTAPVVLLAIVCHECAHGWVSYKLGDPTAKNAGRLTLNPLMHLDPLGALCMLFFHVGWANPVPINPWYYKDRKKGIIYVSLAGPVANFIIAFISLFIEGLLMRFGSDTSTLIWILCQLCYYSAVVNVGLYYLTFAITLCFVTDIAAYLIGRSLGRHKLIPKVSPNKTIEGSVAGVIFAVLIMLLGGILLERLEGLSVDYVRLGVYALCASVVGQFGDLAMSAVKRACGIKDFGNLFPGHGGILDRFDSHLFSISFTFLFCIHTGGFLT